MSGSTTIQATWQKPLKGFRKVSTLVTDTLQQIALRELGDASKWRDLANLNNLLPPYITSDPTLAGARVLLGGQDTCKVPSPAPNPTAIADQSDVYGTDLVLVDGQITDDGFGDYQTVSGISNLEQALENRVATRPNELVYHPTYGFKAYRLIGRGNTPVHNQLAASYLDQAIRSDPRVSTTRNTQADLTGDTISASTEAVTVDGKFLPVGVPGIPT